MGRDFCCPLDPSVLYDQDSHVSTTIWAKKDRKKLYVRQGTSTVKEWVLRNHQIDILINNGFGIFAHEYSDDHPERLVRNDASLISALVERWRPESLSFHMPFGEITITLEDVYMLMGLLVYEILLCFPELPDPKWYWLNKWEDPRLDEDPKEKMASYDGGINLAWLRSRYGECRSHSEGIQEIHTRAYLFYVIGSVLLPTKSNDVVHSRYVPLLQDVNMIGCYAWGAAVLGYLFRQFSEASRTGTKQIAGCTTLLMLWSYERLLPGRLYRSPDSDFLLHRTHAWAYNSKIGKSKGIIEKRRNNPHHHLLMYRGMFDNFDIFWLSWEPYNRFYDVYPQALEPYRRAGLARVPLIHWDVVEYQMSEYVMRQFGLLQHIHGPASVDMRQLRLQQLDINQTFGCRITS